MNFGNKVTVALQANTA